jgi:hypothetical protein
VQFSAVFKSALLFIAASQKQTPQKPPLVFWGVVFYCIIRLIDTSAFTLLPARLSLRPQKPILLRHQLKAGHGHGILMRVDGHQRQIGRIDQ